MRQVITVGANLLAIVALSAQAAGYYDAKITAEVSSVGAARDSECLRRAIARPEIGEAAFALGRVGTVCQRNAGGRPGPPPAYAAGYGAGATLVNNAQGVYLGLVLA